MKIATKGLDEYCEYRNFSGMEPANTIIAKCGGIAAVARITGRSEVRVRRWGYSKARGGTGGLIPAECQQLLMEHARAHQLDLCPDDFFPEPAEKGAA